MDTLAPIVKHLFIYNYKCNSRDEAQGLKFSSGNVATRFFLLIAELTVSSGRVGFVFLSAKMPLNWLKK